jgi:repressor LexA
MHKIPQTRLSIFHKEVISVFWNKYYELCSRIGESPNAVAKKLKFSTATCTNWKKNGNMPTDTNLLKIANYFNVPVDYFKEDKVQPDDKLTQQDNDFLRNIPVYESVSAGFGTNASDYVLSYTPVFIHSDLEAENTIGIRVSGSSMYPEIKDGDTIIVHKQPDVDNKDIAVIRVDDSYLVKQILREDNTITLHSFNPEYEDRVFVDEQMNRITVVGVVTSVSRSFKKL